MTNKQNEVMANEEVTTVTEVSPVLNNQLETVIEETETYVKVQLEDGSFKKRVKYQPLQTYHPTTPEEKMKLFKLLNEEEHPDVTGMKFAIKEKIQIDNVFIDPYEKMNTETGANEHNVRILIESKGKYYATISKKVYFELMAILQAFGAPNTPDYTPVVVEITGTKVGNNIQIGLSLVGFGK